MHNASDDGLIAGMAAGDSDAALAFVRRHQARAYGLALTITRDRFAADEVAQDAFVRAWRYGASYDPRRGTAAAWLLGIVRNAAIDHLRREGQRPWRPVGDMLDLLTEFAVDGDMADRQADLALIIDGLRELPIEQREAFVGAAYAGLSAREMSEAWNVPIGTVKTRVRSAVHKLRNSLAGIQQ